MSSVLYGTGGPDFTVLENFVYLDQNYICDSDIWSVGSSGTTTKAYHSTSTSLGSEFQFSFIPVGKYASNLAFARPDLYEIVIGDNSFKHLSLKDLRSKKFMHLHKVGDSTTSSTRVKLENSISTSSESTLRVEEIHTSGVSMILRIVVNGEVFESNNISVINQSKHKYLYLALFDNNKNNLNNTGVIFPELRICI